VCAYRRVVGARQRKNRLNRLKLECWIALGTLVIPADEILEVEIRPSSIIGDLFRGKGFAYAFPLKMDWADMCRHVALRRKSGLMKYLRFTPDDLDRFVELCKTIIKS
jgi:hypothetical protein